MENNNQSFYIVICMMVCCGFVALAWTSWHRPKPTEWVALKPEAHSVAPTFLEKKEGGEKVTIYVTGAVREPGLYTVSSKKRLAVILEDIGGVMPSADLERVNLAAFPKDGQQIMVYRKSKKTEGYARKNHSSTRKKSPSSYKQAPSKKAYRHRAHHYSSY